MKYICFIFSLSMMLWACNQPGAKTGNQQDSTATSIQAAVSGPQIGGLYSGDFGGSPIYININYAKDKNIAGYNTHKGLRRNLSGELEKDGNGWLLKLREPGDHPYDGAFTIRFNEDFSEGKGNWQPNHPDSLKEKDFVLKKHAREENEALSYHAEDHADLVFEEDGNCTLQYYPKQADGSYAGQLQVVRGTWSRKGDTATVNWQLNEHFGKRQSVFILYRSAEDPQYLDSLVGEGFSFYTPL